MILLFHVFQVITMQRYEAPADGIISVTVSTPKTTINVFLASK